MKFRRSIVAVCLLVWGCQGQNNNFQSTNQWLGTFLTPTNKRPTDCYTEKQEVGQCVKLSECMDSNEIDLENMDVYRGLSCHYLKICCPTSRLITTGTVTPPPLPPKRPGCGWSNPGGYAFRDSSNTHAEFGEFPWMVALMREVSQNQGWDPKDYLGGGTLIHHSVVMTVAHKLKAINYDPSLIKCRLGEWDTQNTNEIYPHQDRNVNKILVHEQFSSKTSANDVALLITTSPFDLTDPHVGIACLSFNEPKMDANCFSMGWGKDFNNNDKYAVWLKKVPLPVVDHGTCEYALQGSRLGSKFRLHNSLICAGGTKNFDTCTGDGGSSLACRTSSAGAPPRYSVYGMVAFGVECGTVLPAAYVNVATMIQWITNKFADEKLDVPFFA
ncbi:phenoloxidase-activating factor 2-like isoform X1 [Pieris napi]|uniref:phenoloxidase-activating factor 2-like isoform X1 n=1 Tax=Pieris napi TaxID=78633 RepID=UPI001FBAB247|nr:phenoloxidase-activating factor 2-like isoform X1 [Pieris napi]